VSKPARIVRAWALMLLLAGLTAVPRPLRAQEKQASAPSPDRGGEPAKKRRGPAQELAHETREAAGEEQDETAQFKQSGSVRLIAKLTGMSLQHAYWLSVLLNFVVIVGVIIWAGRKYLPAMLRNRTAAIQRAMQEAQKAGEEARRRLAEIESRLMKLDVEIGMMRDAAEKEAGAEEARIEAAAKEDAAKIVESAEQEIAAAIKAARHELTVYAAELAVALAERQIRVDASTDQALIRNFAGQLSAVSGAGSGGGREKR
jgi:F0F1-type ATP synthase membrane subunit b/b'